MMNEDRELKETLEEDDAAQAENVALMKEADEEIARLNAESVVLGKVAMEILSGRIIFWKTIAFFAAAFAITITYLWW